MGERFRNFMYGRYGGDQLGMALLVLYGLLAVLGRVTGLALFNWAGLLVGIFGLIRILSRDFDRRRAENRRFLIWWTPFKGRITSLWARIKGGRTHLYFRCPGCSNNLRVPRNKGKIEVTCPKCGQKTIKKT